MTNVAFIGLGIMGRPMALNLLAAGHTVKGFNRTRSRSEVLLEHGGEVADSIAGAVQHAEVVILMLPDSPDVEAVVYGDGGVFATARRGTRVIDMSTIDPSVTRSLAGRGADLGVPMLDAPVSGGEGGAVSGTLSIMVGGGSDDFVAVEPLLQTMGSTIVHVGPSGAGQVVKAANQLLVAGTIALVAESLVLLDAQGVDLVAAVKVLAGGLAGSAILDRKASNMLTGNFAPGFRVELHNKDLRIAHRAAQVSGVALPVGAIVSQLMTSLNSRGGGQLDHTALVELIAQLSGRRGLSTTEGAASD